MRVVIAGGSNFAIEIAKSLLKRGINRIVLVIEDREDAISATNQIPNITVVNGNPTKPEVLNELDLEKCDVFVSATRREESSILAALYAKEHKVRRIFVKAAREDTKMILNKLGMKHIDISESASNNVVLDIAEPLIYDLVGVGVGILDIREKDVSDYPNLIGKRMGDVKGETFSIIAAYQDEGLQLSPDTMIKEGAQLVVLEQTGNDDKTTKELRKIK